MTHLQSPWLNGIPESAKYAHMSISNMRRLVKNGTILSRKKPADENGKTPRGLLVYAPSIDEYLMSQESGACDAVIAMDALTEH